MLRAALPFLLLALPFLAVGAAVSASGIKRGGATIREPRPLEGSAHRRFTIGISLMLVGMVAAFVALLRAVDRLT